MTAEARTAVRRFRLRHTLANGVPGTIAGSLVAGYLAALLRLDPDAKAALGWAVLAALCVMTPLGHFMERSAQRELLRVLAAEAEGRLDPELTRIGYRAALRLPLAGVLWQMLCWPVAGTVVLVSLGVQGVLDPSRGLAIVCSALTGGAIVLPFAYYALRELARPLRERLVARLSLEEQMAPGLVVPLRWKLVAPSAVLCVTTFVFAALFAHAAAIRPVEIHDARIKQAFLSHAATALAEGRQDLASLQAFAQELGVAERVFVVPQAGPSGAAAELLSPAERELLRSTGEGGDGRDLESVHSLAWRRLEPSGDLLVAATPFAALRIERGGSYGVFSIALLIVLGSSLLLGRLVVRDVAGTTARLAAEFERVRSGDLRVLPAVGVDDELGHLGRSFTGVTMALRTTLQRAAAAADRVEGAAGQLAEVSSVVGSASASQVTSLERAAAATAAIDRQVAGIAESSETLTRNVEEASSSVLELGAAAEELHQTSQSLKGQVDEVGGSLSQMVRSVGHVEESTRALAEAALETSASLADMSRATREADGHASETARLSRRVVELAESGLVRMRRSSEGMEAIRDASESARSVIQGLAGRVADIGKVVDVIDDVADETNLLALNAAIIAAQAGDRGRAFSVVADEIKDLAERVLSSTKEIAALIGSVRSESVRAEEAVELGTARVREGVDLSAGVAAALEEITTAARDCGQRTQEIVTVVSHNARASGHAGRLMEGVNGHVQGIRRAVADQAQAHQVVMRSVGTMRELAQQTQRTAEEQARGSARIRDGMESVCEVGERIHAALREQSEACRSAASFLEQIRERTASYEESAHSLLEANGVLEHEVGGLRTDLARFRLDEESV